MTAKVDAMQLLEALQQLQNQPVQQQAPKKQQPKKQQTKSTPKKQEQSWLLSSVKYVNNNWWQLALFGVIGYHFDSIWSGFQTVLLFLGRG